MVGMIAFIGASICWSFFFGQQTCAYLLYKVTAATFSWRVDPFNNFVSAVILYRCCVFWSVFLLNAMLWLNIFMAIDLINSIKYPFRPKSSTFYVLFTAFTSFVLGVSNTFLYSKEY